MPPFDLQSVWTAAGVSAAAVVVGFIFGFLQSVVPQIPSTGTVRNVVLAVIAAAIVLLAAGASGAKPDASNVFSAFIVFLGIYSAAQGSAAGGTLAATYKTSHPKP